MLKCSFTFATICASVSLSVASMSTTPSPGHRASSVEATTIPPSCGRSKFPLCGPWCLSCSSSIAVQVLGVTFNTATSGTDARQRLRLWLIRARSGLAVAAYAYRCFRQQFEQHIRACCSLRCMIEIGRHGRLRSERWSNNGSNSLEAWASPSSVLRPRPQPRRACGCGTSRLCRGKFPSFLARSRR